MKNQNIKSKKIETYARLIMDIHQQMKISPEYSINHRLELQTEEKRLIYAGMEPVVGRDHFLEAKAAKAWSKMQKAAKKDENKIILISGFRSVARQRFLIEQKIKAGESLQQVLTRLAAPGYSEHHTGLAIDLAEADDPVLEERFELTSAFSWLSHNASSFGFHMSYPRNNQNMIIYEPWHWKFSD